MIWWYDMIWWQDDDRMTRWQKTTYKKTLPSLPSYDNKNENDDKIKLNEKITNKTTKTLKMVAFF